MISAQRLACAVAALAAGAALSLPARAQGLPDPTRPPATMYNASNAGAAPAAALQAPQLQSVLVSQGRRVAVIDGETYRAGDTYKGKRVETVGENEVVLVQGRQRQVIRLYPVAAAPSR